MRSVIPSTFLQKASVITVSAAGSGLMAAMDAIYISDAESDDVAFLGAAAGPSRVIVQQSHTAAATMFIDSSEDEADADVPLRSLKDLLQSGSSRVDLTLSSSPPRPVFPTRKSTPTPGRESVEIEPGASLQGKGKLLSGKTMSKGSALFDLLDADPPPSPPTETGKKNARRKSDQAELDPIPEPAKKTKKRKSEVEDGIDTDKPSAKVSKLKEKEEKQRAKEAAKAAKEAEKLEKDKEKLYQRKIAEVNKLRTSKSETLRELHLYLSSSHLSPSSPLNAALPEITARLKESLSELHYLPPESCPLDGLIRFKRHIKARWDPPTRRFVPVWPERWEWEGTCAVVVHAQEIVDLVSSGPGKLREWAGDARLILGMGERRGVGAELVLVIKGMGKYFAKVRTARNREFTAAARREIGVGGEPGTEGAGEGAKEKASRKGKERDDVEDGHDESGRGELPVGSVRSREVERGEVERELVEMQLGEGVFVVHVEKTEELEDWIWNLAADISIRPYKLLSKSHLSFAPTEHSRKAHSPTDLLELMLQEVQGVTASAAVGIAREWPTFRELMQGFERAERRGGVERGESMLEDCEIRNLKNGTASGRKLNKALARKVYHAFRGTDSLALA